MLWVREGTIWLADQWNKKEVVKKYVKVIMECESNMEIINFK